MRRGELHRFPRRLMAMRALVLSLLALLTLTTACGDDAQSVGSNGADPLAGRTFIAQRVEGFELVDGTEIRLTFDSGQIKGQAGCNHLMGDLTSTSDGVLTVEGMGMTEMGCDTARHDQDAWLAEFLMSAPTWTLDGDELTLSTDTAELVLLDRVVADPDRTLEGTRWVVDSLISGSGPDGVVSSLPQGIEASVTFADGVFEGSSGCNSISGGYTIESDTITITGMVTTDAACSDPDVSLVEQHIASVLAGQVQYDIVAQRLTLTGPEGAGLGLRADSGD